MKKIIIALLCVGILGLCACGKEKSEVRYSITGVENEMIEQNQQESVADSETEEITNNDNEISEVIPQEKDESFEDMCLASVVRSGHYGYIDDYGNEVIECQYENARDFSHSGLAPVKNVNDLWGYIDTEGNVVIDFEYTNAYTHTDNGLALVQSGQIISDEGNQVLRYGFIDEEGQVVAPFEYVDADDFKNGYARVQKDGLWGFVNESGEEVITCQYEWVRNFASNGLAPVENENGLWGFINDKNELKIDFQFFDAGKFGDNTDLAPVQNADGLYGYINSAGEIVIDFIYGSATSFDSLGFARVVWPEDIWDRTGATGFINSEGVAITENDMWLGYDFSENGLARVYKKGNAGDLGYINTMGEYVIPLQFDTASSFGDNGWAAVGWNGGSAAHGNRRLFYMNEEGYEVLACDQYQEIHPFVNVRKRKSNSNETVGSSENLKKVMGRNIFEFVNKEGTFKDIGSTGGCLEFTDGEVIISADCDSRLVSSISINQGAKYNFEGVTVGMRKDDGSLTLTDKNWALCDMENDGCYRYKTKGLDDELVLYLNEEKIITRISYKSGVDMAWGTGGIDEEQAFEKIEGYYKAGEKGITIDDLARMEGEGNSYQATVKENGRTKYNLLINCTNGCVSQQDVASNLFYNYSLNEL